MTDPEATGQPELEQLLVFIRDTRGFDFTGYKRSSLARRIRKRMDDLGVAAFGDYQDLLEASAEEFRELFNTVLINVTSFFREPAAWQYLHDAVLPDIIAAVPPEAEIRAWSAGCSSGEETYSLAMSFAELLGTEEYLRRVKIYGTDIDEEALHQARSGAYPAKALGALPEGFAERYFERNGHGIAFRSDLRRRVIFGRHDLTSDAPISKLHLLVCRNTLMYFNAETQRQVIDRFHFALLPGGSLFLGKSEMLLTDGERFDQVSMRHRIFRRRDDPARAPLQPAPIRFHPTEAPLAVLDAQHHQLADELVETSPCPLIALDAEDRVQTINAEARNALSLLPQDLGRPFSELEISYRPVELRSILDRAKAERRSFRVDSGEHRRRGDTASRFYEILVEPLLAEGTLFGTSIVFIDTTRSNALDEELRSERQNLETTTAELQSSNEELETTNEELQSSIEELETTNEELQATNEELETTNEELQSSNEELETMNEEMRIRTAEMDDARSFLEGVLDSIAASVVVVDLNEVVTTWSRGSQDLWGLRADEVVGRPLFALEFGLPTGPLREAVRSCLVTRNPADPVEVRAVNRRGQGVRCRVSASPLATPPGAVLLIETLGRDVTPATKPA